MIKTTLGGELELLPLGIDGAVNAAKAAADVFAVFFRKSRRSRVLLILNLLDSVQAFVNVTRAFYILAIALWLVGAGATRGLSIDIVQSS